MNIRLAAGVLISILSMLAGCGSRGDLQEHFIASAPEGWIVTGSDFTSYGNAVSYGPRGETERNSTMAFRALVIPEMRDTTIDSFATSLLDSGKKSCPDMTEARGPTTEEYGLKTFTTVYLCPYDTQMQSGTATITKMIHGRERDAIYIGEFTFHTLRFNPGERPVGVDIDYWKRMLQSVQVCRGGSCQSGQ